MNWNLWVRQALTIMKMELSRYVLGRRWIGVYVAARLAQSGDVVDVDAELDRGDLHFTISFCLVSER